MERGADAGGGLDAVGSIGGRCGALRPVHDNPIQEWLEAGYFKNKTFKTAEEELNKLKAVTT